MITISKKELESAVLSFDEWFYQFDKDDQWQKTYDMCNEINEKMGGLNTGVLYELINSAKWLKRDVSFEDVKKILEILGYEVE